MLTPQFSKVATALMLAATATTTSTVAVAAASDFQAATSTTEGAAPITAITISAPQDNAVTAPAPVSAANTSAYDAYGSAEPSNVTIASAASVAASAAAISAITTNTVANTTAPSSPAQNVSINSDRPNYTVEIAAPTAPAPAKQGSALATSPMPAPQVQPPQQVQQEQHTQPQQPATSSYAQPQQVDTLYMEDSLNVPTATELQNRQYVNDQLYPATNDPNGRGAFTPETIPATQTSQLPTQSQPGFTFENQSAAGGADAAAVGGIVAVDGTTGAAVPSSPYDEQTQEVSVTVLGTFDQAVLEGFKSLESGITLGLGKNTNFTVDQIAPAVRSFTTDADGNLVLRFSLPMTENILKQQGTTSWQGLSNPVLVWMIGLDGTSSANKLAMVSGQNLSPFAQAILQAAPDYKYRLMFPILDLEDMQKVDVNTVLEHNDKALADATARYGADYFVAAAISSVPNESGVTLKWYLYTKEGLPIAQSALSGLMDEVASLGAGDIARALMTFQENLDQQGETSQLRANNVDIDMLGPGEGFVRMKIANVRSLQDIRSIRQTFVSYGFDGDVRVVGYADGQFVIEISTNSDATNIEGTMRHGGDFTYLSPWTFSLNENVTARPQQQADIGPANPSRPNSQLNANNIQGYTVTPRDSRDVGQGSGLPNRNAPAVQGVSL